MISLDNLTVSYGGWTLFDNISFLINPKDRIGLVGRNGAGKTTLLRIITGEQQPTSGSVTLNGDCTIGYLPQTMRVADTTTLVEETAKAFEEVLRLEAEIEHLTREIAECIYVGVSTDTGCFKFSNTTAHTHAVAAACLTAGIDGGEINRALFETKSRPRFEMERIVFDTMEFHEDGAIAVAVLWRKDIDRVGADMDDLDSIASLTRQIEGVQIGITLIGILTGIYSGDALAAKFGRELALLGIPLRTATIAAQVTIVVIVTYLTLIFGELVPKRIGMNTAEKIACAVARPMRALSVAASPFVWLLSRSTAAITRLLGLKESDNKVTEEEIRSIIQESVDDGEVRVVEQQIVGRVFSLGDRAVDSVMTPRSEIVWIDIAMTTDQIRERVNRNPHSLYPVADGELDKLVGVVYLKDLFQHLAEPDFNLCKTLRPVKFFHESCEVYNAMDQLRSEQLGYGIVCDEFGVTRGIVTLKDIFEALVGEIPEDLDEPDIVRREDGSCLVDGQCSFYDFLAYFNMEEVIPHTAYKTISGLILDELDHIPQTGEKLHWNRFTLEIVDMDGARIDKILVTPDTIPADENS